MPYKDPEKRRVMSQKYSLACYYRRQARKTEGTCSTCPRLVDEPGFKKCSSCRGYMRKFKKGSRAAPKAPGLCTQSDCKRAARPGFKLCAHCLELRKERTKRPGFKEGRKDWRDRVRAEVLIAYGAQCKCCGELDSRVLTVDHEDGYTTGPRAGFHLYLWLAKHAYPTGFRVLCMKCNFTLGHHGYCPHSDLKQFIKLGRPRIRAPLTEEARQYRRAYKQQLKMDCLNAYGGPVCKECGEQNHECLSIDHVNNDGAAHRRADKRAKNLYILLRSTGYPAGFQVLCMNCNHLKKLQHSATAKSRSTLVEELS